MLYIETPDGFKPLPPDARFDGVSSFIHTSWPASEFNTIIDRAVSLGYTLPSPLGQDEMRKEFEKLSGKNTL